MNIITRVLELFKEGIGVGVMLIAALLPITGIILLCAILFKGTVVADSKNGATTATSLSLSDQYELNKIYDHIDKWSNEQFLGRR